MILIYAETSCLQISDLIAEKDATSAKLLDAEKRVEEVNNERQQEALKSRNFRTAKETALEAELQGLKGQLKDAESRLRNLKELQQKVLTADEKNREQVFFFLLLFYRFVFFADLG